MKNNEEVLAKKNKVLHRKNQELSNHISRLEHELDVANELLGDLRSALHERDKDVLRLKSDYVDLLNKTRRLQEELNKRKDNSDLLRIILNNDLEVL